MADELGTPTGRQIRIVEYGRERVIVVLGIEELYGVDVTWGYVTNYSLATNRDDPNFLACFASVKYDAEPNARIFRVIFHRHLRAKALNYLSLGSPLQCTYSPSPFVGPVKTTLNLDDADATLREYGSCLILFDQENRDLISTYLNDRVDS